MSNFEANKAIVLRLIEDVFNNRRLDLLEDVLHPEFRSRGISAVVPGGPEIGPGARRKLYEMFLQAIPDARGEVLDVVAEGDKVVLVDRFAGTHRGEFFGRPGTGDRIEWAAIHIYTIRDGKILEDAVMTDSLAIMQQLGLAPGAANADTAEIKALEQRLIDGIKAKDVKQIMSCYSDDLFAYDVVPPRQYVGAAAFQKPWQGFLGMFKGPINVEVNDLIIDSDGEIAYSSGVQHVTGTTNEGKPFDSTFRITDVFRKGNGKWLIVQEHISLPPDVARW